VTVEERDHSPLPLRSLLLRGVPLALLCAAACAVAAGLLSARREPVYTANALVLTRESSDPVSGGASALIEGEGVSTEALLVARRAVLARAAHRLSSVSVEQLERSVAVSQVAETDALHVTATAADARPAADIANAVAQAFVSSERESVTRRAGQAQRVLRRQYKRLGGQSRRSLQGVQLRERIQSLGIIEEIGTPAPRVAQQARPPAQATSPLPRRDALFGAIFGAVLGVGLAVLWVSSDRRIRDARDASEVLGAPALASFRRRGALIGRRGGRDGDAQAWRLLHLSLRSREGPLPLRTVSVTTVGSDGGRSRVAWGLATTAAAAGERALLIAVEPDARDLNGELRSVDRNRLGALLEGGATLSESVSPVELPAGGSGKLDVVGRPAVDPSLGDALREAAAAYELVVIDTPSVLEGVEGMSVVTDADGTVVVLPDDTDRERLVALRGRLEALKARVVGLVLSRG
jgi:succinoglycan biosynthesis transport protein ExoP